MDSNSDMIPRSFEWHVGSLIEFILVLMENTMHTYANILLTIKISKNI